MQCPKCGLRVPPHARFCPVDQTDVGFPNVRAAETPEEVNALDTRCGAAAQDAQSRSCLPVLEDFRRAVLSSKAVICRSLNALQALVSGDSALYSTFYQQVRSEARIPEDNLWDKARGAVDATLFPNYEENIRFGMLSLNDHGLTTYGAYVIVLREALIASRSTVFECNSVVFFQKMDDTKVGDAAPLGYRAVWARRDRLAMAKHYGQIGPATAASDYSSILVKPGPTPQDEEFIEVHIYGPIHRRAIEKVVGPPPRWDQYPIYKDLETKLRECGASLETL
jgi:hypothetical protein